MANWNGPQAAPKALWAMLQANFPVARNVGIFNRRNIAGTNTPSLHSEGRALDIGLNAGDATEVVIGDRLFEIFCDLGQTLQLEEVIWRRQIWSAQHPLVHAYAGISPHTDHIHVGFTRTGSQQASMPAMFLLRIAQLRTGLEELRSASANLA
jgi:hypothetical protein